MKLLLSLILALLPYLARAQASDFVPLIGIPGLSGSDYNFNTYVNILYVLTISVAAFLVVVRLILAGFQYMFTDIVPQKEQAKKAIRNAFLGLGVILGAVLILNTINPELTKLEALNIRPVTVTAPYGEGVPAVPTSYDEYGTGLDTFNIYEDNPTEISEAQAACQPPRSWVVRGDGTAYCAGAETSGAQDNILNTADNLQEVIVELGLSDEDAESLKVRYDQFVATQEPENLTLEVVEEIRQYYGAAEVIFIVRPPLLVTDQNLVSYYDNQVAICEELTGSDNIVEDRDNGYIACLR